ncbi:unnamed protein product, partial [marine sediment metagenome]
INSEYNKTIFELLHRAQLMYSRGDMGRHFHTLRVAYESITFKLKNSTKKEFDEDISLILSSRRYWDAYQKSKDYGEIPTGVTMKEINKGMNEFSILVVKFQRKLLGILKDIRILS